MVCFFTAFFATPFIIKLSYRFGIVDRPGGRKVHAHAMPRLGGLAIAAGTAAGMLLFPFSFPGISGIMAGSLVILLTGLLDDIYTLSAKQKLAGQVVAALLPIASGVSINKFMLPFYGQIELNVTSYIITLLWILLVTNSINLIDGLDGLAAGVSTIALVIMLFIAVAQQQYFLIGYIVLLIGSSTGFLVFNFHPAKLFMGDIGSLFLGYSISLLSIVGFFKGITITSVLIPIIILAIPLSDTFFAIVRRLLNKQSIMAPDRFHLHHCLLYLGLSHRNAVLVLYGASLLFGIFAYFFPYHNYRSAIVLFLVFLFVLEVMAEVIGLIGRKRKPVLTFLKKVRTRL
nr:MraY family glycosyltransferase [Ectobacillus ponti]